MRLLHIPKTAGNTLSPLFDSVIDHDITREGFMSLKDINEYEIYNGFNEYTVAVVRNPYDRFVSAYFYLFNGGLNDKDKADSERYIKGLEFVDFTRQATPDIFNQIHFRPQHEWIDGVDAIMRFEDLPKDLPRLNTSQHRHWQYYYRGKTKEWVYELYKKDFDLFY